jgi:hypothetical protein
MHNLYAMGFDNFVKVGIAKDLRKRKISLETTTPHDIHIYRWTEYSPTLAYSRVFINNALMVEQKLHSALKDAGLHHKGEWYIGFQKTIEIYDHFVNRLSPHKVAERCELFVSVSQQMPKNNRDFLKCVEEEFGVLRPYVLERFRKSFPGNIDFLFEDFIERMQKVVGGQT